MSPGIVFFLIGYALTHHADVVLGVVLVVMTLLTIGLIVWQRGQRSVVAHLSRWTAVALCVVVGLASLSVPAGSGPHDSAPPYQVQLVYAIPKDGTDRQLDRNETILGTVASAQHWLSGQTGGKRFGFASVLGTPTILRVALSRDQNELAAYGDWIVDQIEMELKVQGLDRSNTLYAVYYEGTGTRCGVSNSPPESPGHVAVLLLDGLSDTDTPCGEEPFARGNQPAGYWEFSLLHELFHLLGAVPECAPHADSKHHVSDQHDLMSNGTRGWSVTALDLGRDDYYGHGRDDCFDAARSPYLRPVPSDAEPPLVGFSEAAFAPACDLNKPFRPATYDEMTIYVVNATGETVDLSWIGNDRQVTFYMTLQPWQNVRIGSRVNMPWVITHRAGDCLGRFTTPDQQARAWFSPE